MRYEKLGDELAIFVSEDEIELARLHEKLHESVFADYERAVDSGEVELSADAAAKFVASRAETWLHEPAAHAYLAAEV